MDKEKCFLMGVKRLTKFNKKFHALGWTLRSGGSHSCSVYSDCWSNL